MHWLMTNSKKLTYIESLKNWKEKLDEDEKSSRLFILQEIQKEITYRKNRELKEKKVVDFNCIIVPSTYYQ